MKLLTALLVCAGVASGLTAEDRYLATQDDMDHGIYEDHGVPNLAAVARSGIFGSTSSSTWSQFVNFSTASIKNQLTTLRSNLKTDLGGLSDTEFDALDGVIIMDIEFVAHPMNWYDLESTLSAGDYADFLDRWKYCIDAVETAFPGFEIGVWGVATPPLNGNTPTSWIDKVGAIEDAANTTGVLDDADYLCPRMYPGWGPSDTLPGSTTLKERYEDIANNGIQYARTVKRSSSAAVTNFKIMPVLAFDVANGGSVHNNDQVIDFDADLDDTLLASIGIFRQPTYGTGTPDPVDAYAFWAANDPTVSGSTWSGYVPDDYWDVLFCHGDYDADGDTDNDDLVVFANYYTASDMRADLNDDGSVNIDDFTLMTSLATTGCTAP